jgi:hypothetical protein
MNPPSNDRRLIPVMWVVWAALMSALPFYKFFLGGGDRVDKMNRTIDLFVFGLFVVPIVISVAIRWVVIPKLPNIRLIFTVFIVGMSIAESLVFYGKFLVPEYESVFFYAGVLAMAQFIPIYGREKPNVDSPQTPFS